MNTWFTNITTQARTDNILDSYSSYSADTFEEQLNNEFSNSYQENTDNATSISTAFCNSNSPAGSQTSGGNSGGGSDAFLNDLISIGVPILMSFLASYEDIGGAIGGLIGGDTGGEVGGIIGDVISGIFGAGGSTGGSTGSSTTTPNSGSTNVTTSIGRIIATDSLIKTLTRHVNQSSAARQFAVNTESTKSETTGSGAGETITRHLKNINNSRVLNFVFRALNQEYLTIIHLKDISFGFTQGVPGDGATTKLSDLDNFLGKYILNDYIPQVRDIIIGNYCRVYDFNGISREFVEQAITDVPDVADPTKIKPVSYWRKKSTFDGQTWEGISVDGIILNTARFILPTDSVIVDALLGNGEALDTYNSRLENAQAGKAEQENLRSQVGIDILKGTDVTYIKAQADAFAEMFNPPEKEKGESQ
jgi:hypothetical protein